MISEKPYGFASGADELEIKLGYAVGVWGSRTPAVHVVDPRSEFDWKLSPEGARQRARLVEKTARETPTEAIADRLRTVADQVEEKLNDSS